MRRVRHPRDWIHMDRPCGLFPYPHHSHGLRLQGMWYLCPGHPWWRILGATLRRKWRKA